MFADSVGAFAAPGRGFWRRLRGGGVNGRCPGWAFGSCCAFGSRRVLTWSPATTSMAPASALSVALLGCRAVGGRGAVDLPGLAALEDGIARGPCAQSGQSAWQRLDFHVRRFLALALCRLWLDLVLG